MITPPWPRDTWEQLLDFYGPPGETRLKYFSLPYRMRLAWDPSQTVTRAKAHELVVESIEAALTLIRDGFDNDLQAIQHARLDLFGGIYNYRRRRGSGERALSLHSWGIAIDLDTENNKLGQHWSAYKREMLHPLAIGAFEAQGMEWGGRWSRQPDPMHFQACRSQ